MLYRLYFHEIAALYEVINDHLSRSHTVKAFIFTAVFVDNGIVVHNIYNGQVMPQPHLKVVGVMRGRYFNHTRPEVALDIFVGDDGYLAPHKRQQDTFAHKMTKPLVVGMHCHGRIAKQCLWTRGCKGQISAAVGKRILDMPEKALMLIVFNLGVRD